jgi:hypothetical protein
MVVLQWQRERTGSHTAGGADGDLGVEDVFAGRLELKTVDKNRHWTYHIMDADRMLLRMECTWRELKHWRAMR